MSTATTTTSAAAETAEMNRWLIGFGLPCLVASVFFAAAIGSGHAWLLGVALTSFILAIISLSWLAISSDTNANA